MVDILIKGHEYDDDFYEIIKKFFPKEELTFMNSVEETKPDSLNFISCYGDGSITTTIITASGKEVYNDEVTLTDPQKEDEHIVRYEIIKSLITGINTIEF